MVFYQTAGKSALQERLTAERMGPEFGDQEQVTLEEDLAPESRPAVLEELFEAVSEPPTPDKPPFMVDLMEAWSQP